MKQKHQKIEKVVNELKRRNLDGVIIYSNGTCNILGPKFVQYFAETRPIGSHNAIVLSQQGETVFLVDTEWDTARLKKQSWIEDIRGALNFTDSLIDIMAELHLTGKRLGLVAANEMTVLVYEALEKKADFNLTDDIITDMAGEKEIAELDAARKAGKIADIGFKAMFEHIKEGVSEYELLAKAEQAMRLAGADDIFNFMSSGQHNLAMHSPTDRRLARGDKIIAEITAACGGQFVQLCRSVSLGRPDPALEEKYRLLQKAMSASLSQVKAGEPAFNISRAMNQVIGEAGYQKYCYPPHMRARGHGIGVGSVAPGAAIDDDTQGILTKDQVIVVHPNQYFPETGYLACGETVLVTDSGLEKLSETETKLYRKELKL